MPHNIDYALFTPVTGYCTYFDTADERIKGLYAADCSKYQNPCPTRYHSTEAFLCVSTFFIFVLNIYIRKRIHILVIKPLNEKSIDIKKHGKDILDICMI